MSASIIFNYCFLFFFAMKEDKGYSFKAGLLGAISGAIMFGSVAGTATSIASATAVGLAAGLFSALFYTHYLAYMNREKIFFDTFGGFGYLVFAFIGGFVIAPIILILVDKLFLDGVISQTFIINRLTGISDYTTMPLIWGLVFSGVCIALTITKRSQRI